MPGVQLYMTPLSHFSRKVRVLLDLYALPYEAIDVGNVAGAEPGAFKDNPLMKVPVLVDGEAWILDSDHIARYLVRKADPSDRYGVCTEALFDLNARAVMNGVMSEEVKLILARRTGVPVEAYAFFAKAVRSIEHGLRWPEAHAARFEADGLTYREIHLVCLWEHLAHYKIVPLHYERLAEVVARVSRSAIVARSSPRAG